MLKEACGLYLLSTPVEVGVVVVDGGFGRGRGGSGFRLRVTARERDRRPRPTFQADPNAAVICLARRRCDVVHAMLRNGTLYEEKAPQAA